jgi:hypothetical protein
MKKLFKILDLFDYNNIEYNIINEYEQIRIELSKNKKYFNNIVLTEDEKIFFHTNNESDFNEYSFEILENYIINLK